MGISFTVQRKVDEKTCLACRYCCDHELLTVKNFNQLELAYHKGHTVLWDPILKTWYMVLEWKCQYLKECGCSIYHDPRKPLLCDTWECHRPGKMRELNAIFLKASERICKQMFGGRICNKN